MISKHQHPKITLDQVFEAISHWRKNKDQYETRGIPEDVWKMIFQLEDGGHAPKDLKRMFKLNSKQYDEKRIKISNIQDNQVKDLEAAILPESSPRVFCEAKISADESDILPSLLDTTQQNKRAVAMLKSTANKPQDYLDMTTIIVEYSRPDGHRLTIHTTSESIHKVMSAFAQQGEQPND